MPCLFTIILTILDLIVTNPTFWHETVTEYVENSNHGEQFPVEINPKIFHDFKLCWVVLLARLIS